MSVVSALAVSPLWIGKPAAEATGIAFLMLAMAQGWHVFARRNRGSDWLRNEITRNVWVRGALVSCLARLILAVYGAPLAGILSFAVPGLSGRVVALGFSLVPLVVGQLTLLSYFDPISSTTEK